MKIAVLDYECGNVIVKDIPKELEELDGDDICSEMGYKMSNVCYMIVEDSMHISINTKGCIIDTTLKCNI